ncbi:hypothetical protein [Nitriliruptor alkaliphilus]|uniref:hypothetical protein n=1 Tax=Nitriliruptor alkaliphilus TaxID=427918 RepID=UPI000696713C|nr:hypothetical protein [Nitriliruptor alkaliphilus]
MRTRLAPLALLLVLAAGCGDDEPRDETGRVTVGDVALATPEGWERIDEPAQPPLLASTRFVDPTRRLRLVQVVVGCDPAGLDALVGAVGQPRGELVVTGARERTTAPEIPGLDRVRRVTLDLGSGREGEDPDFVTEALYGQRGDALVLIELNAPAAALGVDADAVLDSVVVDGDVLADRCAG